MKEDIIKSLIYKRQAIVELSGVLDFDCTDTEIVRWGGDDSKKPTEEAIQARLTELQTESDAQEYARIRKAEYDALNQFEMQFDDELNDTTTWKDAINAIKAKYPKPE